MNEVLVTMLILAALVFFVVARTAVVVPQQSAYVVERLGRYHQTLGAGFHMLIPFVDNVAYRHSLKERAVDIPEQVCITRDTVQVHVDGVLYLQTLDKASEPWGVKVLRYEIKNITPPVDVLAAMEKQMRAEREKRAVILTSEGQRDASINAAEGDKQQVIKQSEAVRQQQINEAEGQASAIEAIARATATGIRQVAEAIQIPGGEQAVRLRVAEQYVDRFGQLAKAGTTMILPANVSDVGSMVASAMTVIDRIKAGEKSPGGGRGEG